LKTEKSFLNLVEVQFQKTQLNTKHKKMEKEEYIGELKDGKYHGNGTLSLSNGSLYVGQFMNGKYHGKGTLSLPNGDLYVGEFQNGEYHGNGTLKLEYDKYVGEFQNGEFHGKGVIDSYISHDGYLGEFEKGVYSGFGKLDKEESSYVGEFQNGEFQGFGKFKCERSHEEYFGEFNKGQYHGNGVLLDKYSEFTKYYGNFFDGKIIGDCFITYENGGKYVGEINEERQSNGFGMLVDENEKYIGEFNDGRYSGNGRLMFSNGDHYIGEFYDGRYHGNGRLIFSNGGQYTGEFNRGCYHGKGTLIFSNGDQYIGEFHENSYHGKGTLMFSNGNHYIGEFKCHRNKNDMISILGVFAGTAPNEGLFDGKGTFTYFNGTVLNGEFRAGIFVEKQGETIKNEFSTAIESKRQDIFYLFFDTESTGLPKDWKAPVTNVDNWPRLVQLAYLGYDKEGNQICSGDFIIKPNGFSIPADSSRIHGITNEKAINEGKTIFSVLEKFSELVNQSTYLVAHNMSFDEKVIGAELLRNGMQNVIQSKSKICTMEKSTNFCAISGPYGYKWPKLSELHYKLFRTGFEEAHNAAVDITATAKCFWELKKLGIV
jgi:DNA polymerase-3 subunit epsilon